jgi:hypothetical protein
MRNYFKPYCPWALILFLLLFAQGCSEYRYRVFDGYKSFLTEHPTMFGESLQKHRSPFTRYPANAGYDIGFFLGGGFPLVPIAALQPSNEGNMIFIVLPVLGGSIVGTATGFPAWLASGWWYPETYRIPPIPNDAETKASQLEGKIKIGMTMQKVEDVLKRKDIPYGHPMDDNSIICAIIPEEPSNSTVREGIVINITFDSQMTVAKISRKNIPAKDIPPFHPSVP